MDTSLPGLQIASVSGLADRLSRVASGRIRSAFDEFLAARVPIQLGGMQDPFGSIEASRGITLSLLRILDEHDYPTIISTKSIQVSREPYLSLLQTMNVLLRFSVAGVKEECRSRLEVGCDSLDERLTAAKRLSDVGIPVSIRIQPVIPGHEEASLSLVRRAADAGAKHVSFEHLKIATEEKEQTIRRVSEATETDVWKLMVDRGVKRLGRDYTLTAEAKCEFLRAAKRACRNAGVKFGAGDTEFIHQSDGAGCCNGSGHFLKGATQFRANFVGVMSSRKKGDRIRFSDLQAEWKPRRNVHRYLTTNSRGRSSDKRLSSWTSLLAHRWNGESGPYSPGFFFGVVWTGKYDKRGFKVYRIDDVL